MNLNLLIFLIGFIFAGTHYSSYSALAKAVQKGQVRKVETLLNTANAAAYDNQAIRMASAYGNLDIVKLLLSRPEVDPGAMDNEALIMAARYGHTEIVRNLLAHPKVDPSSAGRQAVFLASAMNRGNIVKLFIEDGRANNQIFRIHTLDCAAQFGNVDLVRFLLGYPLFSQIAHLMVIGGDILSIKTLVEAGYKIDQETLERALRYHRLRGSGEIVTFLESLKEAPKLPEKPLISMTEQCAICLIDENLMEGYMTTCNHQFHVECLQSWIAKHNSCPVCRSSEI